MKKYYHDLSYDEIMEHIASLEKKHPQYIKKESIGKSDEGRDLWCLFFTDHRVPQTEKSGFLLQANIHSVEMTGTSFILYFVENILNNVEKHENILKKLVFYCIPRVNPDGAEAALSSGLNNRSKMTLTGKLNGFVPEDIDKNGLICQMRWKSQEGKFKEHPNEPRLMIQCDINNPKGRDYYHVVDEGIINNWDGKTIDPDRAGMVFHDFNRNFPSNWISTTNHTTGDYPLCFNETKAVADFVLSHKNIYIALDFHNGSGAIMYPPAYKDESEYSQEDMKLHRKIFKLCEGITKLPAMCSRDYGSLKDRYKNPGKYEDWLYECQGILNAGIEFGYIYQTNLGLSAQQWRQERKKKGPIDDKVELRLIKGQDKGGMPIYYSWKKYNHPQLGEVEIGGICKAMYGKIGENNYSQLFKKLLECMDLLANICPDIEIALQKKELSEGCYIIHADVKNKGSLSTSITKQFEKMFCDNRPIIMVNSSDSIEIVDGCETIEIDHLDSGEIYKLKWIIKGSNEFTVSFDSDKTGIIKETIII